MGSKARARFNENKKDIDELWNPRRGGRWRCRAEAFSFILANVPAPDAIPSGVRDQATRPMFEQKDSRKVWDLADGGWRTILAKHRDATLERWLDYFHTPKTKQVDELYESLLGLKKLSSGWYWQKMTALSAAEKLDTYITARGNIAHRTEHDEAVYKSWGTDFLGHVERLVDKCETAVSDHVNTVCKTKPW